MKYIKDDIGKNDADCAEDAVTSTALLEQRLEALQDRIRELDSDAAAEKASLQADAASILVDLQRGPEAWALAREALDSLLAAQDWEKAAVACLIMFHADQPDSLAALGQAIWLAVTFPVDPELTVAVMQNVVDETPDDSDGAAVAAVVAHYVADMRAEGKQRDDLLFFTNNMIGNVARRHSDVSTQEKFDNWFTKLELDDPEKFLVRLRNIVDVMVQEEWWFDRDALQNELPVN
jgi:response regulator RpfG family c-di-GMP phosphodiesterase